MSRTMLTGLTAIGLAVGSLALMTARHLLSTYRPTAQFDSVAHDRGNASWSSMPATRRPVPMAVRPVSIVRDMLCASSVNPITSFPELLTVRERKERREKAKAKGNSGRQQVR